LGFGSLQHIPGSKVHWLWVCLTHCVPPSGFGYPLDGLLPSIPGRAFQIGSARGIHPSESYLPPESWPLPAKTAHLPFSPAVVSDVPVGPARQAAASGCCPRRKFPPASAGLARRPREAPLGFAPSRVMAKAWTGIPPDLLSRALPPRGHPRTSRRPRVSIGHRLPLVLPPRAGTQGRSEGPFEGFRTGTIPHIRARHAPGYLVHLTPRRALLSTGRCSSERASGSTEVDGTA
jgi:hypothetical protein